ncbi:NAD(P)/FAD-dependent oxidoreductase [Afipia sp. TerB]
MPDRSHKTVAVIGAGPAGLMAAEVVARGGLLVTVYDRMPSAGRKFLMAGRGGLNLTHSEPLDAFLSRYGDAAPHLGAAVEAFPPDTLRAWSEALGQPTFVGSSGRVFPEAFKASPLLRAWLRRLDGAGVRLMLRHRWMGWTDRSGLSFDTPEGPQEVQADAMVLALGGASWPRLGSDGGWADILDKAGVAISPLRPANSGFTAAWSDIFRDRFEGTPLKGVSLTFNSLTVRSEAMVTREGLEGGGVYALSAPLRDEIARAGQAVLHVDVRPDLAEPELRARLSVRRGKQSFSTFLRKAAGLSPVAIGLLYETTVGTGVNPASLPPGRLAQLLKAVPITLAGVAPLDRAISTAGGVAWSEVDGGFMLRRHTGVFVAGEMLDWEAPTGGYLLQASFATGAAAGRGILEFLDG